MTPEEKQDKLREFDKLIADMMETGTRREARKVIKVLLKAAGRVPPDGMVDVMAARAVLQYNA